MARQHQYRQPQLHLSLRRATHLLCLVAIALSTLGRANSVPPIEEELIAIGVSSNDETATTTTTTTTTINTASAIKSTTTTGTDSASRARETRDAGNEESDGQKITPDDSPSVSVHLPANTILTEWLASRDRPAKLDLAQIAASKWRAFRDWSNARDFLVEFAETTSEPHVDDSLDRFDVVRRFRDKSSHESDVELEKRKRLLDGPRILMSETSEKSRCVFRQWNGRHASAGQNDKFECPARTCASPLDRTRHVEASTALLAFDGQATCVSAVAVLSSPPPVQRSELATGVPVGVPTRLSDAVSPLCSMFGTTTDRAAEIEGDFRARVWVAQPASVLAATYTLRDMMIAQVAGSMRIVILPPHASAFGHYAYPELHPLARQSIVDNIAKTTRSKSTRFGRLSESASDVIEIVLNVGDVLYVPPLWLIERSVEGDETSLAISVTRGTPLSRQLKPLLHFMVGEIPGIPPKVTEKASDDEKRVTLSIYLSALIAETLGGGEPDASVGHNDESSVVAFVRSLLTLHWFAADATLASQLSTRSHLPDVEALNEELCGAAAEWLKLDVSTSDATRRAAKAVARQFHKFETAPERVFALRAFVESLLGVVEPSLTWRTSAAFLVDCVHESPLELATRSRAANEHARIHGKFDLTHFERRAKMLEENRRKAAELRKKMAEEPKVVSNEAKSARF